VPKTKLKEAKKQRANHQRKPSQKGHKSSRGVPEIYEELKKPTSYGLTTAGKAGINSQARSLGISASQYLELIGRRELKVVSSEDWALMEEQNRDRGHESRSSMNPQGN
jgi:hypothetical protein